MNIERWGSSHFDWLTWISGSIVEVWGVRHRTQQLLAHAQLLRDHAVAWCPADQCPCRPKVGYVAVMFRVDEDRMFWTHLKDAEFDQIFGGVRK